MGRSLSERNKDFNEEGFYQNGRGLRYTHIITTKCEGQMLEKSEGWTENAKNRRSKENSYHSGRWRFIYTYHDNQMWERISPAENECGCNESEIGYAIKHQGENFDRFEQQIKLAYNESEKRKIFLPKGIWKIYGIQIEM